MIKFNELKIGDKIYILGDQYDSTFKPCYSTIIVTRLTKEIIDKELCLTINRERNTYRDDYCGYTLIYDKTQTDILKLKKNIITTDYNKISALLREIGLKHINEKHESIKNNEKAIEQIREAYWDFLNNLTDTPIQYEILT